VLRAAVCSPPRRLPPRRALALPESSIAEPKPYECQYPTVTGQEA